MRLYCQVISTNNFRLQINEFSRKAGGGLFGTNRSLVDLTGSSCAITVVHVIVALNTSYHKQHVTASCSSFSVFFLISFFTIALYFYSVSECCAAHTAGLINEDPVTSGPIRTHLCHPHRPAVVCCNDHFVSAHTTRRQAAEGDRGVGVRTH